MTNFEKSLEDLMVTAAKFSQDSEAVENELKELETLIFAKWMNQRTGLSEHKMEDTTQQITKQNNNTT